MKIIKAGYKVLYGEESARVVFTVDRDVASSIDRYGIKPILVYSPCFDSQNCGKVEGLVFIQPARFNKDYTGEYEITWMGLGGICNGASPLDRGENLWFWHMARAERDYLELLKNGWTAQEVCLVVPGSMAVEVTVIGSYSEWRAFLEKVTDETMPLQMREVMVPLLREMEERRSFRQAR